MEELEDLLLEAAGRRGASSSRGVSRSQTRSDVGDESDRRAPPVKRSRPQIPPEKRFGPRDTYGATVGMNDGGNSDEADDSDSELSIGSDLYKDDEDREKLSKMSELEREMILADRSTRRDDYWLKKRAKASSSTRDREETPPPPSRFGRSSVRSEKGAAKVDELRSKRLKVQDSSEGPRKMWGAGTGSTQDSPPGIGKKYSTVAAPSDSGESDQVGLISRMDPPKFEDVKAITIKRSKLAKWLVEPFFEELMAGCFVRIGIGMTKTGKRIYRLCLVKNVDATDPNRQYKLEGRTTHKYLNCIWGRDASAARWQMAKVSDALPLEEEFRALEKEVERSGGRMPGRRDVLEKIEAIKKVDYSAATVKKSSFSRSLNVAAEKNRLRKELQVADIRGDEAQVRRIQATLKELEMLRQPEKDSKSVKLAEMNRKNRAENFKNASESKPVNASFKAGDAGYDPFSRRWTRSCNYYAMTSRGNGEGNASIAVGREGPGNENNAAVPPAAAAAAAAATTQVETAGKDATATALEAAADAGKPVDTAADATESNLPHNFEIPISLATLHKFGGPQGWYSGFMARKQKIEATIGRNVPENDGRRHALTLTISDYKRRMGLLRTRQT